MWKPRRTPGLWYLKICLSEALRRYLGVNTRRSLYYIKVSPQAFGEAYLLIGQHKTAPKGGFVANPSRRTRFLALLYLQCLLGNAVQEQEVGLEVA